MKQNRLVKDPRQLQLVIIPEVTKLIITQKTEVHFKWIYLFLATNANLLTKQIDSLTFKSLKYSKLHGKAVENRKQFLVSTNSITSLHVSKLYTYRWSVLVPSPLFSLPVSVCKEVPGMIYCRYNHTCIYTRLACRTHRY